MSNIGRKKYDTQLKILFNSFFDSPKTRLIAALETNILNGNVCRHVAKLFKLGKIQVIKKAPCKITKHEAEYLSTNPKFWKNLTAEKTPNVPYYNKGTQFRKNRNSQQSQ